MRTRLFSLAVAALAAVTVLAAGQPDRPAPGGQPDRGGKAGGAGDKAVSLDGEWTVVSAARDGTAVDGADKMTVTIKGNVVTFGGAGAGDKLKMRALRLDFGPNGMVRVAEAGADGKFGAGGTGGTGTNPGGAGGTAPPAGSKDEQPGGAGTRPGGTGAGAAGTMSGVYVCTPDFLAISVFAPGAGAGTGGAGGTGGTGTNPGGAGGTGTNPGGKDAQPGGAGTRPGGTGAGAAGTGPQMQSHVSVVLKRSGGARP